MADFDAQSGRPRTVRTARSRMLDPNDLVLCAGTLPRASFRARATAAGEAGFSAISLFVADYQRARTEGASDADLRAILAHHGLRVAELEPLLRWIPGAGPARGLTGEGAAFFRHGEEDFYAAAEALGARSLNAAVLSDARLSTDRIAEAFAGLCERAAEHGLLVHLEFLPRTQVPDLQAALEIVRLADRPNGGITLDVWHHFRSGVPDAALRSTPGARVLAVQLSDAPREPEADWIEETTRRRLLPGEGAIDLVGVIQSLDAIGSLAPLGVEVFCERLAHLAPGETARRAAESARTVIERARGATRSPRRGRAGGRRD